MLSPFLYLAFIWPLVNSLQWAQTQVCVKMMQRLNHFSSAGAKVAPYIVGWAGAITFTANLRICYVSFISHDLVSPCRTRRFYRR